MDAVAYQMSFDKEQLALLCANYDRCIDSLGAENKRLQAENAKLRELVRDMWDWLAPTAVGGGAPLKGLHDRMRELGIEVEE